MGCAQATVTARHRFPTDGPTASPVQHLPLSTYPAASPALPGGGAWATPSLIGIRTSRAARWLVALATVGLCAGYVLPTASLVDAGSLLSTGGSSKPLPAVALPHIDFPALKASAAAPRTAAHHAKAPKAASLGLPSLRPAAPRSVATRTV